MSMARRSDLRFFIYVELKFTCKHRSWTLGDIRFGSEKQTEQQNCMSLAPKTLYGQGRYGNPTNTEMIEVFVELTHQCKSCIEGN